MVVLRLQAVLRGLLVTLTADMEHTRSAIHNSKNHMWAHYINCVLLQPLQPFLPMLLEHVPLHPLGVQELVPLAPLVKFDVALMRKEGALRDDSDRCLECKVIQATQLPQKTT